MQCKIMHIVRVVIDGTTGCKTERHLPGVCKYAWRKETLLVSVLVLLALWKSHTLRNHPIQLFKKFHSDFSKNKSKNHPTKKLSTPKQAWKNITTGNWVFTNDEHGTGANMNCLHRFICFKNECSSDGKSTPGVSSIISCQKCTLFSYT